jgi:hypothetical protein
MSAGTGAPQATIVETKYACRLELDLNTPADLKGVLPREHLPAIFEELASLGEEIAEKGDVP